MSSSVAQRELITEWHVSAEIYAEVIMIESVARKHITPLHAELYGPGGYRVLSSVADLAAVLINSWPDERGDAYEGALVTCLDVLEGHGTPEQAREAFTEAAGEAGIWLSKR